MKIIKKYWIELLVILVVHVLALVFQARQQNYLLDDSVEYLQAADNLVEHGTLYCGDLDEPLDPALYTKRPPGYPVLLTLKKVFSDHILPILIIQLLLSIFSMILMIRIFKPEKVGRVFLLILLLVFPAQFIYANMVMAEIFFQFALTAATVFFFIHVSTGKMRYVWGYQALIIVAILIKPVLYPFVVINMILCFGLFIQSRQRHLLISALMPIVFLVIYGGINQQRTGKFHVSSIQQINLVDYNLYYFLTEEQGAEAAGEIRDSIKTACSQELQYEKRSDCLSGAVIGYIKDDPLNYALFHLKGMVRYFIDPGRFDLVNFFGVESRNQKGFLYQLNQNGFRGAWKYFTGQSGGLITAMIIIAIGNLLRIAGFFFFLFNRKINGSFRLFLFLLVGYLSFATGPLGASRFMLPVVLLMTGAASVQYAMWIKKILPAKGSDH